VGKNIAPRPVFLFALAVVLLATPKPAQAYVDPGAGAMMWQLAAAVAIGCLFYTRRVFTWVRHHLGFHATRSGYLFATLFALTASALTVTLFDGHPPPRFGDLFLIGVALTAYLFTWDAAAYLLALAMAVSAWVLSPTGSFLAMGFAEWYRLVSFAVVSVFAICAITRLKMCRPVQEAAGEGRRYQMHGASAGAG
jgi:hypothetical protein